MGRTGRSDATEVPGLDVAGLRFAGLREAVVAVLGFVAGRFSASVREAGDFKSGERLDPALGSRDSSGLTSAVAGRFLSPRVCPVR